MPQETSDSPDSHLSTKCSGANDSTLGSHYWTNARWFALFGTIEAISLVLWAKSEDLGPPASYYVRWIGYCGLLAGAAFAAQRLVPRKHRNFLGPGIWGLGALLCAILFFYKSEPPSPHVALSLEIGSRTSTNAVALTNKALFTPLFRFSPLPGKWELVQGLSKACLVVQVEAGESNKTFAAVIKNDSQVKISDLEVSMGFPDFWQPSLDSKWRKVESTMILPGKGEYGITNMQFWSLQSPYNLFPHDSLSFPQITNACSPEYVGKTFKGGRIQLQIRATGLNEFVDANVIFVPVVTNLWNDKPFVAEAELLPDGTLSVPAHSFQMESRTHQQDSGVD